MTERAAGHPHELSLIEWVVLALLVERPRHGFAVSKELTPESDLGRVITVHRPAVYRALERLEAVDLLRSQRSEPSDSGPDRTPCTATADGILAVDTWLDTPVEHVRELRMEFLAKLRLNQRRDRSASRLVEAQHHNLVDQLDALRASTSSDVVDMWRRHNAAAAAGFLDNLHQEFSQ